MLLTIFFTDGSQQYVNLHPSFLTEQRGRNQPKRLSANEVRDKAFTTALAIAGPLYKRHSLEGLEDAIVEYTESQH